jgi:predicted PurR-regulated permease PerM
VTVSQVTRAANVQLCSCLAAADNPRRDLARRPVPLWYLAAAIATLYFAREVFIPLAFAATLALILTPVIATLQKLRVGRVPAVLLGLLMVVGILGTISWVLASQLLDVASQLPNYRDNIEHRIQALRGPQKGALAKATRSINEITSEIAEANPAAPAVSPRARRPVPVTVVPEAISPLRYVYDSIRQLIPTLGGALIVVIFTAFILIKREDLRNRMLRLVGLSRLSVVTQAFDDATTRVSRYLLLQLAVNSCLGALFGTALFLLGIPYAALWGILAALLRFVPYVGAPLAAMLPVLLSLAVFPGWAKPIYVLLAFLALELVTANVVEPLLYGAHTGIASLAILVAAVFWAMLWGPPGLILSTPMTVCLVVLGRYVPQLSFLYILLGDEEVLGLDAQFYQRLLAEDQDEARELVDVFLADHTVLELYDTIILPALTLAEQDRHRGALDPGRQDFLFLGISEMLAELSSPDAPKPQGAAPGDSGRVFCLPVNDTADELAAAMLGQVLHQAGAAAVVLPRAASFQDLLSLLHPEASDVICISAVPPFAFAGARELSRRIRTAFPKIHLIVGIWGFPGDPSVARGRFDQPLPDHVITNLAGARDLLSPAMAEPQEQPTP